MYPLNMKNPTNGGHAVANDEAEHKTLTEHGYEPPLVTHKPKKAEPKE